MVQHIDLPMGFVYITQSFVFGGGLLGIWYGILSARCAASCALCYNICRLATRCLYACSAILVLSLCSSVTPTVCDARSWEEQREGSALGFQEFKANLPVFLDKIKGRGA